MSNAVENNFFDLSKIANAEVIESPFKYAIVRGLLSNMQAHDLKAQVPKGGFYRSKREFGSDKTYQNSNRIMLPLGEKKLVSSFEIGELWHTFIAFLQSKQYIQALSNLLDMDLSNCQLEITLKEYGLHDFISPHTDKAWVSATHLFFFNDIWDESWGGMLRFLTRGGEPFFSLAPTFEHSVVFARSDDSWHEVTPIVHPNKKRLAFQVALWNTLDRYVLPGRVTTPLN